MKYTREFKKKGFKHSLKPGGDILGPSLSCALITANATTSEFWHRRLFQVKVAREWAYKEEYLVNGFPFCVIQATALPQCLSLVLSEKGFQAVYRDMERKFSQTRENRKLCDRSNQVE
jgi:hypothetical protein